METAASDASAPPIPTPSPGLPGERQRCDGAGDRQAGTLGGIACRAERQHGSAQYLRHEEQRKAGSPQPRPAGLPPPYFLEAAPPEGLLERSIDEAHPQARRAHDLGRCRILGGLSAERANAAGRFEVGAPPQHGLALGEADAERIGEILRARLVAVEESAFEIGPQAEGPAACRRRADEA